MVMKSILPPKSIFGVITTVVAITNWTEDDGTSDPWLGYPYIWEIRGTIYPQLHSSKSSTPTPFEYNGLNIVPGMWIADISNGRAVRINSVHGSTTATFFRITVEDVDRFNTYTDFSQTGTGVPFGNAVIFDVGLDGLPIFGPITQYTVQLGSNNGFVGDLTSRFRYRNSIKDDISIKQIGHTFQVGQPIYMNSSGVYVAAQANSNLVNAVVGVVSTVGTPGSDYFTFKSAGEYKTNISPTLPGSPGSLIYVDPTTPGALTATRPNLWAKPIYIRLETGSKGILLDRGSELGTITGTTNQITVANGDGILGVPTISITSNPAIPGTNAMTVPIGNTAQEIGVTNGMLRYNSQTNKFRAYENGAWVNIISTGSNNFSTFTPAGNSNGISIAADLANDTATFSGGRGIKIDGTAGTDTLTFTFVRDGLSNVAVTTSDSIAFFDSSNSNQVEYRAWSDIITDLGIGGGGGGSSYKINDADNDTFINTEVTADSDTIVFATGNSIAGYAAQNIMQLSSSQWIVSMGTALSGSIGAPITLTSGDALNNTGGSFNINAGNAQTSGAGGPVNITAGNASGSNQNGGIVQITSGTSTGTGTPGYIWLNGNAVLLPITNGANESLLISNGMIYYNSSTNRLKVRENGAWINLSVPITQQNELASLDSLGNGIVAKTADATYSNRTITSATTGLEGISVSNGTGISGNPTIGLDINSLTTTSTLTNTDTLVVYDGTNNRKITWSSVKTALDANSTSLKVMEYEIFFNTVSPISIGILSAGSKVVKARVLISNIWSSPETLKLGISGGADDAIMPSFENDTQIADLYTSELSYRNSSGSNQTIIATLTNAGSPISGRAVVTIEYYANSI